MVIGNPQIGTIAGSTIDLVVTPSTFPPLSTYVTQYLAQLPGAKRYTGQLFNVAGNQCVINNFSSVAKMSGYDKIQFMSDPNLSAAINTNPNTVYYWVVSFNSPGGAAVSNIYLMVTITAYVEFSERNFNQLIGTPGDDGPTGPEAGPTIINESH